MTRQTWDINEWTSKKNQLKNAYKFVFLTKSWKLSFKSNKTKYFGFQLYDSDKL